jgi:hypothetical protein
MCHFSAVPGREARPQGANCKGWLCIDQTLNPHFFSSSVSEVEAVIIYLNKRNNYICDSFMLLVSQHTESKRFWVIYVLIGSLQWILNLNTCQLFLLCCEFISQKFGYLSCWFQITSDVCSSYRNTLLSFKMWHFLPSRNPLGFLLNSNFRCILSATFQGLGEKRLKVEYIMTIFVSWGEGWGSGTSPGMTWWVSTTPGFRKAYV